MEMSREFKVGDKVVCTRGHGTVTDIITDAEYPIIVGLDDEKFGESFTDKGLCYKYDTFPTLFHANEKPEEWENEVLKKVHAYAVVDDLDNIVCLTKQHGKAATIAENCEYNLVALEGEYVIRE